MRSHCVVIRVLLWVAMFCAIVGLSCRRKAPRLAEVNKPQPTPSKVGVATVPPDVNAVEPNIPVEVDPNSVAVTVNGINVTEGEIDKLVAPQLAVIAQRAPKQSPAFIDHYRNLLRQQVLESIIMGYLLDEKVQEANIVVTGNEVTDQLRKIAAARKPPLSLEEFRNKLEEYGQNYEVVKEQIRRGLSYQRLIEIQSAGKINVTEEDARNYYSENPKQFEAPEQVRASHILIKPDANDPNTDPNQAKTKALAKIQGLLEQIKAGADFAELARTNSSCPSASSGGDLDFFSRGQKEPAFEEAAFATDVNQVSGIVETSYGYHIIKVTDRKAAAIIPFEQIKDQLINQLTQKKQSEFVNEYVQSLRANAKIVYPPGKGPKTEKPAVLPGPPEHK